MSAKADMHFPALVGFIEQLPMPYEGWADERRQEWLDAFVLLLDFSVQVKAKRP